MKVFWKSKRCYLCVTKDKYELPIAIFDSVKELQEYTGMNSDYLSAKISKGINRSKNSEYKIIKVEFDEDIRQELEALEREKGE